MLLAIVLDLKVRMKVAIDVNRGHLALQLLDVIEVLLGYVMRDAIERTLELVVKRLQEQVEAVKAKLIATWKNKHLSVDLVVQFVTVWAIVPPCAYCGR